MMNLNEVKITRRCAENLIIGMYYKHESRTASDFVGEVIEMIACQSKVSVMRRKLIEDDKSKGV